MLHGSSSCQPLKSTTQHWFTSDACVFLYEVIPLVAFTCIAIWKSRATSTVGFFKFPGVLRRRHCQTMALDIQQYRDHSWSSDKKEAKNMESGEFTALLLSVSEAVCASVWVTPLKYDSLNIQFKSSSQPQTTSSFPSWPLFGMMLIKNSTELEMKYAIKYQII